LASLNEAASDLIYHILERIIACEGGYIETVVLETGEEATYLVPDIPPHMWCDDCKKRYMCKIRLLKRWMEAPEK
jgi:hypothetical protein